MTDLHYIVRKRVKKNLKEKKKRMKEAGEDTGPTRQQLKHNKMANSACKVQVAVDCSFDDYMSEKVDFFQPLKR